MEDAPRWLRDPFHSVQQAAGIIASKWTEAERNISVCPGVEPASSATGCLSPIEGPGVYRLVGRAVVGDAVKNICRVRLD